MNAVRFAVAGLWAVFVLLPAVLRAQNAAPVQIEEPVQQVQDAEPPASNPPLEELAKPPQAAQTYPMPILRPERSSYAVGLHVDGNLVGRIRLAEDERKPVPLLAQVSFFHEDKLVDTAPTEPSGYFQLTRLMPGTYVVAVVCRYGQVNFEVEVRAFDKAATPEDLLLDVILLPNVDLRLLEDVVVPEPCSQCGAAAGGCCCEQKHHPWGLLGLAGLAGLAGLHDDGKPVSPFKPVFHH